MIAIVGSICKWHINEKLTNYCDFKEMKIFFLEMKNVESGGLWEEKGRLEQKDRDICFLFLPSHIHFSTIINY